MGPGETPAFLMSYEEECEWYALYGNPMQDAMDYELMAQYDRWDGYRMDLIGVDCDEHDYEEDKNIQRYIVPAPVDDYNEDIPF